jgi:sec-independent protein translocase protein TatA
MGSIGLPELLIVLFVVLLILGPKRLPGLGRSLGSGMREFKDSITRKSGDDDDDEKTAAAALGRPDEETPKQPASDGAVSEKR